MKKKFRNLAERLFPGIRMLGSILSELQSIRQGLNAVLVRMNLESELKSPDLAERYRDDKRLLKYGFKVNSQNAEDGMIHEIFRRIGHTTREFVEIGVGTGVENNTAFLLATGWSGVWIDGSDAFKKVFDNYSHYDGKVLRSHVGYVTRENISGIFADLAIPSEFDLMSLDIDQNTYHVWGALTNYRPRVVVIEYNSVLPADVDWKVTYQPGRIWDQSQNFGASLKAFESLGTKMGYSLVGCDLSGCNAFFVRSDLVRDLFCPPFTAINHYQPMRHPVTLSTGTAVSMLDRNPTN